MLWFPKKRIYADAAAATPLSESARRELERLLPLFGNPGALHREATLAKDELEKARATVARAIGAHPHEVVFTASGTEGNNLALAGALRPLLAERGELNAVTCVIEHPSIRNTLRALEREGLYVTELPVNGQGLVDPKAVAEAITGETALVSIQLVNSEVGTIQPIREIAKEIRRIRKSRPAGLPLYFHTDASQAPLWLPVAVEQLGVDLMTLDAQKVLGPKGIGALYVRKGVELEPLLWGGSQEGGLRAGTQNTPLAGAFAVALAEAQMHASERAAAVSRVRDHLIRRLKRAIPNAVINGPSIEESRDARVANNINVSIPGLDAQMAVVALDAEDIACSTRSACDTGEEEPSHVLKALGVAPEISRAAVRLTLLPSASASDARRIAHTLGKIVQRYGNVV